MCIIMIFQKDKPRLKDLKSAERFNPDGNGISYIKNKKVYWNKGISIDELYKISQAQSLPQIIHCRIGTVGENTKELCHPFPISKYAETKVRGYSTKGVLFHNGHWQEWQTVGLKEILSNKKDKLPNGQWSDSRLMAWMCFNNGISICEFIEGQKIAIMTPKGVKTFGSFMKDDKTKVSNKNHKYNTVTMQNDGFSYYDDFGMMSANDEIGFSKPYLTRQEINKNQAWYKTKKLSKKEKKKLKKALKNHDKMMKHKETHKDLPVFKGDKTPIYNEEGFKIGHWFRQGSVWKTKYYDEHDYKTLSDYEEDFNDINKLSFDQWKDKSRMYEK